MLRFVDLIKKNGIFLFYRCIVNGVMKRLLFSLQSKSKCSNASEKSNSTDCTGDDSSRPHPPLIAKWRNGVKLQLPGRFEGDGKILETVRCDHGNLLRLEGARNTTVGNENCNSRLCRRRTIYSDCRVDSFHYQSSS